MHTPQQATEIQVKSWKELRDEGIEKQDLDYSCGSSAVATILRSYYGIEVYEKDILKEVEKLGNEGSASFSDLQHAVKLFGFTATGIATDIDTLKTIKIPALLYLLNTVIKTIFHCYGASVTVMFYWLIRLGEIEHLPITSSAGHGLTMIQKVKF